MPYEGHRVLGPESREHRRLRMAQNALYGLVRYRSEETFAIDSKKLVTKSKSFSPGVHSSPLDTSTPQGDADLTACFTLPGFNPPARMIGKSAASDLATFQSKDLPVPPASSGCHVSSRKSSTQSW